jgi:predicted ATP-grasp superfamily ATP-dependent carboligase
MNFPVQPLILVGASTRAAALSALRAGFSPRCIDLFADRDLAAVAPVTVLPAGQYPHGMIPLLEHEAAGIPVVYTGGLENHPVIYREIAQSRPFWGYLHPQPFDAPDSVRNPFALSHCCEQAGLFRPACAKAGAALPTDGSWLCKPYAGAGGGRIVPWHGQEFSHAENFYYERFQSGVPLAAAYAQQESKTEFLGVTRQLIGTSFLHSSTPFTYCGSVGPVECEEGSVLQMQCLKLGPAVAPFDPYLRGLFGVDFLWDGYNAQVLEVNPRYTASMELLEWADPRLVLWHLHAQAFGGGHAGYRGTRDGAVGHAGVLTKGIYFAPRALQLPQSGPWDHDLLPTAEIWPSYGDIPSAGATFARGEPVMTLYAKGEDEAIALARLRKLADELDHMLDPDSTVEPAS